MKRGNALRRSELKPGKLLQRKTALVAKSSLPRTGAPLPRRSAKRARQERTYSTLRREFLAARPRCEFPHGCGQPATTVQHLRGRSGERLNDTRYWAASCWSHNEWAESHTGEALAIGWLIRIEGQEAA